LVRRNRVFAEPEKQSEGIEAHNTSETRVGLELLGREKSLRGERDGEIRTRRKTKGGKYNGRKFDDPGQHAKQ